MNAPNGIVIPTLPGATTTRYTPQHAAEPPGAASVQLVILDPGDAMAIARRLVADKFTVSSQQALYRYREEYFEFQGSSYRKVDNDTVRAQIWVYLEGAYKVGGEGYKPLKPKKSLIENVLDALAAICNLDPSIETPFWLGEAKTRQPAHEFLQVANGLLHLPTGELRAPSPLYFGFGASEVSFDAEAPKPCEWLKFLDKLFGEDRASTELLQDMMGYALAPDTSQQKIMLLVGPPRSGKGTIAKTITALVGENKVVGPTMASLGQNFGLAALIGKSLAIIADARIGGRADQALIAERLLSISGEDTHTIDRKFKEPWTGRLATRFIVLTNELPRLTDNSGALANRFVVLVMKRSFLGEEDRELAGRHRAEGPGILNWALEGYRRLRARGHFVEAASGVEAIQELEELASPIKAFIAEKCNLHGEVKISDLYSVWKQWCAENGHEHGSKLTLGRNLRAAISALKQSQSRLPDGSRTRAYVGISLKSGYEVMSRRPARATEADVRRAIRAAKHEGAAGVDVLPDGTIRVLLNHPEGTPQAGNNKGIDRKGEIVL